MVLCANSHCTKKASSAQTLPGSNLGPILYPEYPLLRGHARLAFEAFPVISRFCIYRRRTPARVRSVRMVGGALSSPCESFSLRLVAATFRNLPGVSFEEFFLLMFWPERLSG